MPGGLVVLSLVSCNQVVASRVGAALPETGQVVAIVQGGCPGAGHKQAQGLRAPEHLNHANTGVVPRSRRACRMISGRYNQRPHCQRSEETR